MKRESIRRTAVVVFFACCLLFSLNSRLFGNPVKDAAIAKAQTELARLARDNGYPALGDHIANVDAAKMANYAEMISQGKEEEVFNQILQEKKDEILAELYKKGKERARGVVGNQAISWLEFAESHQDVLKKIADRTYNGDFKGAGNAFWQYGKQKVWEEIESRGKEFTKEKIQEGLDFFLKDLIGQSVGGYYLKLIELEMMAIEAFEKYVVEYYGTFPVALERGGEVIYREDRTFCKQYSINRDRGADTRTAFYNQFDWSPLPDSIETALIGGFKNAYWVGTYRDGQRPDAETIRKELEACYVRAKIDRLDINAAIKVGPEFIHEVFFEELKKKMEEEKRIIIDILKFEFKKDFDLIVSVVDNDSGAGIQDASVKLEGEEKQAAGGTATYTKNLEFFDKGGSVEISGEADGYESKTESFSIDALAQQFDKENEVVKVDIKLVKLPEDFDLFVTVADKASGDKISGAEVTFDGETNTTSNGIAEFTREYAFLDSEKSANKVDVSAKATDYKDGSVSYTVGELSARIDKAANRIDITLSLEPEEKIDEIDRFEVDCAPGEISENEVSACQARVYFKSGKESDVSDVCKWTPQYVDDDSGDVDGQKVKAANTLPHTVLVEATYDAPKEEGGKPWTAQAQVKVNPDEGTTGAAVALRKKADKTSVNSGDTVVYTYEVSNPGTVSLTQVDVSDDKCSPLTYGGGDTNNDIILDPQETWIYECSAAISSDTTNTATVRAQKPDGTEISDSASATVTVQTGPGSTSGPSGCNPPQVLVPYVLYINESEAISTLKAVPLMGQVIRTEYSDYYAAGLVIEQMPPADECVDPNSTVNLVVSKGPEPEEEQEINFTAELDCGDSFELAPGDFAGRGCGIVVKGWRGNTEDRVEVKIEYNTDSGIEVFPGDTSAPPSLMYTAGVSDYYDSYIFSQSFRAKDNAPPGITTVRITVSQKGAGQVTLNLTISVLRDGLLPSSGPGIRPPANVTTGSGGEYCVWRYKLFGDPPPCFHFVKAVCDTPRYNNPSNGYELVGTGMTWSEGSALMGELSQYFDDAYGCSGAFAANTKDSDGDGVIDKDDKCPIDNPDDTDGDGVCDSDDRCPDDNPDDTDGDGVCDSNDPCPKDKNDDSDGDGKCDSDDDCPSDYMDDSDGDGTCDSDDDCPYDNPDDTDEDGVCDSDDPCPEDNPDDTDGDGVCDSDDPCPEDNPDDTDGDGACDSDDPCPEDNPDDSDGDGVCDSDDPCPEDNPDDTDGDGVCDSNDPCPEDNPDDANGNGVCDSDELCASDADCPPGYACTSAGRCEPIEASRCTSNADCGTGYRCDTASGECVFVKLPDCNDTGCPDGYVCDRQSGECVYQEVSGCRSNSDCATGYVCRNGECVSPFDSNYTGFTSQLGGKDDQRSQQNIDRSTVDQTSGGDKGSRFTSSEIEGEIEQIAQNLGCQNDGDCMDGFRCVNGRCVGEETSGTTKPPAETPSKPPEEEEEEPEPPVETASSTGIGVEEVGTAPAGQTLIVDGQLIPVEGWPVKIAGMTLALSGPVNKTTTSSSSGAFNFTLIPAGEYVISVTDWDYGMTSQGFTAPSGKAIKITLQGSCPYLYVWTDDGYAKENDIYSVARVYPSELLADTDRLYADRDGLFLQQVSMENMSQELISQRSYRDYYRISRNLTVDPDGYYRTKIREQEGERSLSDQFELWAVDHPTGRQTGVTQSGRLFLYEEILPLAMEAQSNGAALFDKDFLEVALPATAFGNGVLAIDWQGFQKGDGRGKSSSTGKPKLLLQRRGPDGIWQTVDYVYPRDEIQQSFFILDDLGAGWDEGNTVRLVATSCHPEKFHRVDALGWARFLPGTPTATHLPLVSAVTSGNLDVRLKALEVDGDSVFLGPGEEVTLKFESVPIGEDLERSFIFVSQGVYVPMPAILLGEVQ